MGTMHDPFEPLVAEETANDFAALSDRSLGAAHTELMWSGGVVTAKLQGFDIVGNAMLAGLAALPGELVVARSTVPLTRSMFGSTAVLVFESGNARLPIIVGILHTPSTPAIQAAQAMPITTIDADEDSFVITAEREIVLRCGDASITLTRAGKVIIKGNYILSRSTGYNKIKGAAIDIN